MKLKEITDSYSKKYEAEDFKEAGKLAKRRKGGKFKLGFRDKNGDYFHGDSKFKLKNKTWQIYPDNRVQSYVAINKEKGWGTSFRFGALFSKRDFEEMEIVK